MCIRDRVARTLEVLGVAILDVGAASLEVTAVGAGADLLVGVVARQPNLDVVGLTGREAQVAGAQDVYKRQAQTHRYRAA